MRFQLEFPTRPIVPRNDPLTVQEWNSFKSPDGSFTNVRELKFRIFRGVSYLDLRGNEKLSRAFFRAWPMSYARKRGSICWVITNGR